MQINVQPSGLTGLDNCSVDVGVSCVINGNDAVQYGGLYHGEQMPQAFGIFSGRLRPRCHHAKDRAAPLVSSFGQCGVLGQQRRQCLLRGSQRHRFMLCQKGDFTAGDEIKLYGALIEIAS